MLDQLNAGGEQDLVIDNSTLISLHPGGHHRPAGRVRVRRSEVLLAVPSDTSSRLEAQLSGRWIEKRDARVMIGLGLFSVTGTLQISAVEPCPLDEIAATGARLPFRAITDAEVTWLLRPDAPLRVPCALVPLTSACYIATDGEPAPARVPVQLPGTHP